MRNVASDGTFFSFPSHAFGSSDEAKQKANARPCATLSVEGVYGYGYAEVLAPAGCRGAGEAGRRLEEVQTRKNRLTGLGWEVLVRAGEKKEGKRQDAEDWIETGLSSPESGNLSVCEMDQLMKSFIEKDVDEGSCKHGSYLELESLTYPSLRGAAGF